MTYPHFDRYKFKNFSDEELEVHIKDGEQRIEELKKLRDVAEFAFSINATNTLTRMQGYVESAHALAKHTLEERQKNAVLPDSSSEEVSQN